MDPQRPLKIHFLPYISPSHVISLHNLAQTFAVRGQHATIIATTNTAAFLRNTTVLLSDNLTIHVIPFPFREAGLPENTNELSDPEDMDAARKLHYAFTLLRKPIEEFMDLTRPDCVISDGFYTWSAEAASARGIPRLVFSPYGAFAVCMKNALLEVDPSRSGDEPFLVPGLPDPTIFMPRSQVPSVTYNMMVRKLREIETESYGVIMNTFDGLERAYVKHHEKSIGHKVFTVGPTSHVGPYSVGADHPCLTWLDRQEPKSVLYVSFGSWIKFPAEQLNEIAYGLELSGCNFIWIVRGKDEESEEEERKWLPRGFRDRIKSSGKGLVLKGWAPQRLILEHSSTGGFMSHCGWNSILEGINSGLTFATWPLSNEQFYNEKLVTQVLGIGVEVGAEEWNMWYDIGKRVIKRERVAEVVRKLMDSGDEMEEMRRKATELGIKVKRAVEEGGSSDVNLKVLIDELKRLRDGKVEPTHRDG